ncbi:hypothetical protein ABIC61_000351 [Curtobacterium sp. 1544]|jgi:hypothetical protein
MNPITVACPDCSAAAVIDISGPGVAHAVLEHDETCPRLNHPAFGLHHDRQE